MRRSATLRRNLAAVAGAAILSMGVPSPARAAAGHLDASFRSGGTVTTDFAGHVDIGYPMALQPDGKILVAGESGLEGNPKFALARYNADGSLDPTFGGDGKVTTDLTSYPDDGLAMAIQSNGKIVMAGGAGFGAPNEKFGLVRYNPNGTLDATFGGDGKVVTDFTQEPDVVFALAIQSNGKLVAGGGSALGPENNPKFALARYNPNGTLDATFGGDGKRTTDFTPGDDDVYSLAIQSNGKIVAAGQSGSRNATFALARYTRNGILDSTFGGGDGKRTTDFTKAYDSIYSVVIQPDGKIVAAGAAGLGGPNGNFAVARYLA